MLSKNETVELECIGFGTDFEGVCRHDGQVVFVPGAMPGERVIARIIKVTKAYAAGRLETLLSVSGERARPPCPHYPRCGGCTAQHMSYQTTLRQKRRQLIDCLERIGGVQAPCVLSTIGMENPWRYRNKAAFPVGGDAENPRIGCFAAPSHDIVDAPDGCLLQTHASDALVRAVREWMRRYRVAPYNEETHSGLLRRVMMREAADGSAMLLLVIHGEVLPHAGELVALARGSVPALRSVVISTNTRRTNVILGDMFRTLWGDDALLDSIAGFSMRVSPRSFFQVNREQAEVLFGTAIEFAALSEDETVWDVYCGCGSITLPLSKAVRHAVGIEIVEDAIEDARENARRNGVRNVTFIAGAAEDMLPQLAGRIGKPDAIVVDPPRKGCAPAALFAIADAHPARIVYVSCNPATLARDVKILAERGYALVKAQPVDMFCWTGHVESVALLRSTAS